MSKVVEDIRLVVVEGSHKGRSVELEMDSKVIVGRGVGCDLCLPDQNISRQHCIISFSAKGFIIKDLDSFNGCFVNDCKVEESMLHLGDIIQIAKVKLQLQKTETSFDESDTTRIIYTKELEHPIFNKPSQLEMQLLHEVGKLIQSEMPVFKMLGFLLEKLIAYFQAKHGYICIPSKSISIFRSIDEEENFISNVFLISHTVLQKSLNGVATISHDTANDEQFLKNSSVHDLEIKSIVCVPIQGQKNTIGAIYLDTLPLEDCVDKQKLDLPTAIGKQTGIAIERIWREEETLQQSEARNRALLNAIPDLLLCVAKDGTIQSCKQAKKDNFLEDFDKKIGKKIHLLSSLGKNIAHFIPQVLEENKGVNFEHTFFAKEKVEKVERNCEVQIVQSSDKEVLVIVRDITRHKQMQKAILKGKEEWQATFDAVLDLIFITDSKGKIQRCNFSVCMYFNKTYQDLLGNNIQDFFGNKLLQQNNFELTFDNKYFEVWCYVPTKIDKYVYVIRDITKRKEWEKNMQNANKLSALGLFSAGIAHEVGNPLASISMLLQRLKKHSEPEVVVKSVTMMEKQIDRLTQIVKGVSSFSKHSQPKNICNMNVLLQETTTLLSLDPRSKQVDIDLEVAENLPSTLICADQIQQTIINICINALDAMPGGGELTIKASSNEEVICIAICDTGLGIAPENVSQIFTPFFSSKGTNIGLGLYLSLNYVQAHGGSIDVQSELGKGTKFLIYLPFVNGKSMSTVEI